MFFFQQMFKKFFNKCSNVFFLPPVICDCCLVSRNQGASGAQCPGRRITGWRRNVPTMSQVLPLIQYICSRKTLDSNMQEQKLVSCPGRQVRPWWKFRRLPVFVIVKICSQQTNHFAWNHFDLLEHGNVRLWIAEPY